MKNNILILFGKNYDTYFFSNRAKGVTCTDIYNRNIPMNLLKIFRNSFLLPLSLKEWKKNINLYDYIIIFDSEATPALLKWIYKRNKYGKSKVIFYYRNTISSVKKQLQPSNIKKYKFDIWSYNVHDCERFGLKYNNQVINKDKMIIKGKSEYTYDLVFLGYAKGRQNYLKKINDYCIQNGIKTYFYIPDLSNFEDNKCLDGRPLEYDKYIQILQNSKAVLDLVSEENYGLTLRPLEGMFLNKKIVTNYTDIRNYDFYNKNNIFIINNSMKNLKKFLLSDSDCVWNKSMIEKYDIEKWIERFFIC